MNEPNKKENHTNKTFEDIKHIDENGVEYWYGATGLRLYSLVGGNPT